MLLLIQYTAAAPPPTTITTTTTTMATTVTITTSTTIATTTTTIAAAAKLNNSCTAGYIATARRWIRCCGAQKKQRGLKVTKPKVLLPNNFRLDCYTPVADKPNCHTRSRHLSQPWSGSLGFHPDSVLC